MDNLFLRTYTRLKKKKKKKEFHKPDFYQDKAVFVFDTETTTDFKMGLKVGYFQLYINNLLIHQGLFYKEATNEEIKIIYRYAKRNNIKVYKVEDFRKYVFYPVVFNFRALCLAYNLPFDIPRISIRHTQAKKKESGGFSFILSENSALPRIVSKQLNSETTTVRFSQSLYNKHFFNGNFLDVQKLACVLLERKKISLEEACEVLKTKTRKKETDKHGKITFEYLDYLIKDVRATYEVYLKLKERFESYQINIPLTDIFSSASLGKNALKQMGISSFHEQNPDFKFEILGNVMICYYGGRVEVLMRKEPVKVSVLDFTSMYPTITLLIGLWDFIIADRIEYQYCTSEIIELLKKITLEDLRNPETWKKLAVIVKIKPNAEELPVRSIYNSESKTHSIAINKLTFNGEIFYSLADIIRHKLQTGNFPEIIEAIKFVPLGKQQTLQKTQILGTEFNPSEENFIKKLVEERYKIKESNPEKADSLKIIANSTTYGIFIQLDPEDEEKELDVYGIEKFSSKSIFEKEGEYYNPIIAVSITAGARLLLTMAELFLQSRGYKHYYMDTDSIFVPPEVADELSDFFQTLNPYDLGIRVLKIEKRDKWLYAIASKRYVLYDLVNGKIVIDPDPQKKEYKLHGLGHITNPFGKDEKYWHYKIWEDILKLHYGQITYKDLFEKYSKMFVVSKMSITNWKIMNLFKNVNGATPYNFYLRGIGRKLKDKVIKPIAPYTKDYQSVVYEPFINLENGEVMQGEENWKTLYNQIIDYINHPESKFDGDIGLLKRKHVRPKEIVWIGKESNKINEDLTEEIKATTYKDIGKDRKIILNMSNQEAEKRDVSRPTLWKIQKRLRKNPKKFNWKTRSVKRLIT
ncbi:MAG: hypothetical protein AABX23_04810 [Nanoarchaeota archaeon]